MSKGERMNSGQPKSNRGPNGHRQGSQKFLLASGQTLLSRGRGGNSDEKEEKPWQKWGGRNSSWRRWQARWGGERPLDWTELFQRTKRGTCENKPCVRRKRNLTWRILLLKKTWEECTLRAGKGSTAVSQRTIGSVDSDQETRKPGLKDGLDQESTIFHILNESSFGFMSLLTQYRHNTSEANNKQLAYNLTFPSSLTIGPATILFSQDLTDI